MGNPAFRAGCIILTSILMVACNSSEQDYANIPIVDKQDYITAFQPASFLGIDSIVPSDWQLVTPSSNMRLSQYSIPGELNAEIIVFYFGPKQGGSVEANINRWVNQFKPIEGKPVKPKVTDIVTSGGFDVTLVEIQGDYARGVGMGPVGEYQPNQTLMAAITRTPKGNLYIQFHGDTKAVKQHYDGFLSFVKGLRVHGDNE